MKYDFGPLGTTLCPSAVDVDARGASAKEHRQIRNALKRLRKKRRKHRSVMLDVRHCGVASIDGAKLEQARR